MSAIDERNEINAHVYYDTETRETAARIREGLGARFEVQLGHWHDQPISPHPKSIYQVAFAPNQFTQVVFGYIVSI